MKISWSVKYGEEGEDEPILTGTVAVPGVEGWDATVLLRRDDEGVTMDAVTFEREKGHREPPSGGLLRRLDMRELQELILEHLESPNSFPRFALPSSWFDNFDVVRRPGRRGRPLVEYAIWARRLVREWEEHPHRSPVPAIADRYDKSESQVYGLWSKAVDKGLIKDTQQGKPGGSLTALAKRLLKNVKDEEE